MAQITRFRKRRVTILLIILIGALHHLFSLDWKSDFQLAKHVDFSKPKLFLDNQTSHQKIIYNRIPSCASDTMVDFFNKLSKHNMYHSISPNNFEHKLYNESQVRSFSQTLDTYPEPYIYSEFRYFVDFAKYNLTKPAYINYIRDPIDRVVSVYDGLVNKQNIQLTFDECILSDRYPSCYKMKNYVLNYFCGHADFCTVSSKKSLIQAMQNVQAHYILVGLYEDIPMFLEMLDKLLPHFFHNANTFYFTNKKLFGKNFGASEKRFISEGTKQLLKTKLSYEYTFYEFIRQRIYNQKIRFDIASKKFLTENNPYYKSLFFYG